MAYTPTEWKTGDTITAEKLNKLENGILKSNGLIVHSSRYIEDEYTIQELDKTAQEIMDAVLNGQIVYIIKTNSFSPDYTQILPLISIDYKDNESYSFVTQEEGNSYSCSSLEDYPRNEQ